MGRKMCCCVVCFILLVLFAGVYPLSASGESNDNLPRSFDQVWENVDGLLVTQPLIQAMYRYWTGEDEASAVRAIQHGEWQTTYEILFWMAQWEYNENDATPLIFAQEPYDEYFSDKEVKREELKETLEFVPVAHDALVFFANANNPVNNVSSRDMEEVYAGHITNWNELGGEDMQITAFQRPSSSYSQKIIENTLMLGKQLAKPPIQWIYAENGPLEPMDVNQAYDNSEPALGYTMYYYAKGMYGSENTKLLSIDGVMPSKDTIMNGEYPFRTAYYAIFPKRTPKDHPVRALVSWLLTEEGQRIVKSVGMIPLADADNDEYMQPDLYPQNETRQSYGTGGLNDRNAEPLVYSKQCFLGIRPSYPVDMHAYWDEFLIELPESSPAKGKIAKWRQVAREELKLISPAGTNGAQDIQEYVFVYGNIASFYLSLGMGYDTVMRTAVFDLKEGKQLRLSDLFLNGFNYIDYINQTLLQRSLRQGGEALGIFCLEEDKLKRSFSGLPEDYLYFILSQEGTICLAFAGMNPFVQVPSFQDMFFVDVPIWHGVSPWGGCKIEENYTEIDNDDKKAYCYKLSIRIDEGGYPEAEHAVNEKLARGAECFLKMVDTQPVIKRPASVICKPFHEAYGDFHSFVFETYVPATFSFYSPTIGGFIINLHTGKEMLTNEQAKDLAKNPAASFLFKDGTAPLWEDMQAISEYSVSEDSVVHSIWLDINADYEKTVEVELIEKDGSCVRISVPIAAIDF